MEHLGAIKARSGFRTMEWVFAGAVSTALLASCGGSCPCRCENASTAPTQEERLTATAPPPAPSAEGAAVAAEPDDAGDAPSHAIGVDLVRAEVGPAGGTLRLRNGVALEIPSGALGTTVTVTLAVAEETQSLRTGGRQTVSPFVRVEPRLASQGEPFVLSAPVVSVPRGFGDEDLALAIEHPETNRVLDRGPLRTTWQNNPVMRRGNQVSGTIAELPGHRAVFVVAK